MYKISINSLNKELKKDVQSKEINESIKEVYKSDKVKKQSYVFKTKDIDVNNINASDTPNLKFIRTSAEYGYTQMQIDNYVEKVERAMDKIAQLNFVAVNSQGARISLRNKAEMEVRYQDMLSDLKELKNEQFVVVSQHRDSSLRCACWQGLIYLKDTDGTDVSLKNWHEWNNVNNHITPKPIGYTENNQPYYSLKEAMEHGLFSYNCRHRFIKYEPGAKVPKQYPYNPNKESTSSLIDKEMRQMEQNIRRAKERQTLALTPKELKKWQAKSKRLQAEYDTFCKKHNRVRNDWRTSIGVVERGVIQSLDSTSNEKINQIKSYGVTDEMSQVATIQLMKETTKLIELFETNEVEKLEVNKLNETLSINQIVNKIGGPDLTDGSCASLSLAYAANKIGLDVTDYRDGKSREIFAQRSTLLKIANIPGVKFIRQVDSQGTYLKVFKKAWEDTIKGKEYIMITGKHAAVMKEENGEKYYLELQSSTHNGWMKFEGAKTLTKRFGCTKGYLPTCTLIDIESLKNIKFDFKEIMGYINTRAENQRKGFGGHEK